MFFGSTGSSGLIYLVLEVVSNCFDRVIAGQADHVHVTLGDNGTVVVADNGPGMPISSRGDQFLEQILTTGHTTATADGHSPHVHLAAGCGLGPVCAVCESLVVETTDGGGSYQQAFSRGRAVSALQRGAVSGATGTSIRMTPDPEIFGATDLDRDLLRDRLRTLAWLTPGLTVELDGERFGPVEDLSELFTEFQSPWDLLHGSPFMLSGSDRTSHSSIALGWTGLGKVRFRSFCNFREMGEGGTHLQGVEEGLRTVFGAAPVIDLMRGLIGIVSVAMLDPNIGGPTRGRLDSPEAIWLVADTIASQLPAHLERDPVLAQSLRERMALRPSRS
jgi:DNA gyrase subunit B